VEAGEVAAGDELRIVHQPPHDITVLTIAEVYYGDHRRAADILEIDGLPAGLRSFLRKLAG
jgi:MOSC domain-containing protein YiiM